MQDKNAASRRYDDDKRARVFSHYGTECAYAEFGGCVGQIEIDHKNGCDYDAGGKRSNDSHGGKLYRKLVKDGFPDSFQAVCRGHNRRKTWLTDAEFRLIMNLRLGNTEGTNQTSEVCADAVETTRNLCPEG